MATLIAVAITKFLLFGALGFRRYRSSRWNFVDTLYYPLAAVGVILLFISNSNQRRLLELNQLAATHRSEANALLASKPSITVRVDPGLTDSSLALIATISAYADACQRLPLVDPRCTVATQMKPEVDEVLRVSRAPATSPESRLLNTCLAAAQMVQNLADRQTLPEQFRRHYRAALERKLSPNEYEKAEQIANDFHAQALEKIETFQQLFKEDTAVNRFVLDKMLSEAELGRTTLQGLYPCIVAPQEELAKLIKWTTEIQSKEQFLRDLELERARAREATGNPIVTAISLNLWPWILVFALSLKFGKGIAAVRKAYSTNAVTEHAGTPPRDGNTYPPAAEKDSTDSEVAGEQLPQA